MGCLVERDERLSAIDPKNRRCLCEEELTHPIKLSSLSDPERSEGESKDLHFRGFQIHSSGVFPGAIISASCLSFSTISMIELPDQG
jgi:hypothetical protein